MNIPHQPCPLTEQAVGWALHALEPDEEMALLLHVPHCGSCQATVRDAEGVLASLGAAVEQVEPPRSLRGAILAAAAETPQRPVDLNPRVNLETTPIPALSAGPGSGPPSTAGPPLGRPPAARPPKRTPGPRASRAGWFSGRRGRLMASSLALVGVLTVGGLAVYTAQLQTQRDAEQSQAQGIVDFVAELGRPGVRHALLAAAPDAPTVAAVLVTDGQRRVFTIGLTSNDAGRTVYVLWGIRAGSSVPEAVGTFDVATADQGVRTVGSGGSADEFVTYAISLEQGVIAPAAPSAVLAQGQVSL